MIGPRTSQLGRKEDAAVTARFMWEFAGVGVRAMELITILNHCHRFRGFVYQHARFSPDNKSIAQGLGRDLFTLPISRRPVMTARRAAL